MRTTRVRIAVAVDESGRYDAVGFTGAADYEAAAQAEENMNGVRCRITYVEADVPLPEPEVVETVEGRVG